LLDKPHIPGIAIVGRPNVGKSTLFNRFLKKRRAITDPTPGVTRDSIGEVCEISGKKVILFDTGGIKLDNDDLDEIVKSKSLETAKNADLILLLMDVMEITPEDREFIEYLRPYSKKIILVVNKVDNEKREQDLWNFYSIGFEKVVGISSAHGSNISSLEDMIVKAVGDFSGSEIGGVEEETEPEIKLAILGKPNTGKSTLVNSLTNQKLSIVSEVSGTTRDVVRGEFIHDNHHYRVLDTAGIRKKKKVNENVEYYSVSRAIGTIEESDVIFLMIDAEEGISDQDKKIAGLIVKKGKGVILVLSKWDKIKASLKSEKNAVEKIRFHFPVLDFAPVVTISAIKNKGTGKLLKTAYEVWSQLNTRVETSHLNRLLAVWVQDFTPPGVSPRKNYKIRYITQFKSNPVIFILFINRIKAFPESYIRYITNMIRNDIGFKNVPITLELRKR